MVVYLSCDNCNNIFVTGEEVCELAEVRCAFGGCNIRRVSEEEANQKVEELRNEAERR